MNWLEYFLPTCCTKKSASLSINVKPSEIKILPTISVILPDIQPIKTTKIEEPEINNERNESPKFNIIKLIPCFEAPIDISRATTETSMSLYDQSQEIYKLRCSQCEKLANGYCVLCPQKKFCNSCYKLIHLHQVSGHKFCKYLNTVKS